MTADINNTNLPDTGVDAWLHEITEPDGKHNRLLSFSPDNPWSHWIELHRARCAYKATPLSARASVAVAVGSDQANRDHLNFRKAVKDLFGWDGLKSAIKHYAYLSMESCRQCNGTGGVYPADPCRACRGTGKATTALASLTAPVEETVEPVAWRDIPVDDTTLGYVLRYGGRCRECADHTGICPNGLPCDIDEAKASIRHVLRAINYGMANGFLASAASPSIAGEEARENQIKHMVNRFLAWKLPESFSPDAGISFKAEFNEHTAFPMKHQPSGTNLFDAVQAEAMVRHMLGDDHG